MTGNDELGSLQAAYRAAVDGERRRALATAWIHTLEQQETDALTLLERHRAEADLEQREADAWAGKGFRAVLWAVFGRLEERRQQETTEALAAAARFAAARVAVDRIQQQLAEARASRPPHGNPAAALEALRAALAATDPAEHQRVLALEGAAAAATAAVREHDEALAALARAREDAGVALARLESARALGTWDLLGGGLIASAMKRERVRDAIEAIGRTGTALDTLRRELADVRGTVELPTGLAMGSGAWTFDVWFDNIFSDLNMQSRINETRLQVEALVTALDEAQPVLSRAREQAAQSARAAAAAADAALLST